MPTDETVEGRNSRKSLFHCCCSTLTPTADTSTVVVKQASRGALALKGYVDPFLVRRMDKGSSQSQLDLLFINFAQLSVVKGEHSMVCRGGRNSITDVGAHTIGLDGCVSWICHDLPCGRRLWPDADRQTISRQRNLESDWISVRPRPVDRLCILGL